MPSPLPQLALAGGAAPPAPHAVPVKALVLSVLGHLARHRRPRGSGVLRASWTDPSCTWSTWSRPWRWSATPAEPRRRCLPAPSSRQTHAPSPRARAGAREAPKPAGDGPALPRRSRRARAIAIFRRWRLRRTGAARQPWPAGRAAVGDALGQVTGLHLRAGRAHARRHRFPHAWYLRQVLQKVEEHWQTQNRSSEPAQKPRIYVEIRTGRLHRDASHRAELGLAPSTTARRFVPSPRPARSHRFRQDWANPSLRVLFNFDLRRG